MLSKCLPKYDGYVAGGSSGVFVEISYKMMVIKSGTVTLKLDSPQSELYSDAYLFLYFHNTKSFDSGLSFK